MNKEQILKYLESEKLNWLNLYNEKYNGLLRTRSACRHIFEYKTLYDDLRICGIDHIIKNGNIDYMKGGFESLKENNKRHKNKYDKLQSDLDRYGYNSDDNRERIMYKRIIEKEKEYIELIEQIL